VDHGLQLERGNPMRDRDDTRPAMLKRRARRLARRGQYRKAALALRERAALQPEAASFVALGDMYRRASRTADAVAALKQGMYLHQQNGAMQRAQTVARMLVALDPWGAERGASAPSPHLERSGAPRWKGRGQQALG